MDDTVRDMIVELTAATRKNTDILLGASPRATLALIKAAKAYAYIHGRESCIVDDVKEMAVPVLAHRIKLKPSNIVGNKTPQHVINELVEALEMPAEWGLVWNL